MVDLRYTLRHSWLGRDYEVDVGLDEYYEDFRTMEHIITLNLGYLFEYNIGEERKGRTTGGTIIKTKKIGDFKKTKEKSSKKKTSKLNPPKKKVKNINKRKTTPF